MLQILASLGRASDRRSSHRYATTDVRIALQWWAGDMAIESAALLLNIGEGGALILADKPPPLHQAIRLRMERTRGADYVDARVVRLCGLHEVALAFRDLSRDGFLAVMTSDGDTATLTKIEKVNSLDGRYIHRRPASFGTPPSG